MSIQYSAGGPGLAGVARPGIRPLAIHGYPSQTVHPRRPILSLVPAHPKRYCGGGKLHFITASCYRRQAFLGTAVRRDLFLRVLEQMRRRYGEPGLLKINDTDILRMRVCGRTA